MIGTDPAGMGFGVGLRVMVGVALARNVADGARLAVALGAAVAVFSSVGVALRVAVKTAVGVCPAQAVRKVMDINTCNRVFAAAQIFAIVDPLYFSSSGVAMARLTIQGGQAGRRIAQLAALKAPICAAIDTTGQIQAPWPEWLTARQRLCCLLHSSAPC